MANYNQDGSGGFKKGQPRPAGAGRQKGTPNKTTKEIREAIQAALSGQVDELAADLEGMTAFKKWQILNAIARYVLPTYNKNEDTVEHKGEIKLKVSFKDKPADDSSTSGKKDDDFDFLND